MSTKNHIPDTVSASLEARLAPFPAVGRAVLDDVADSEASRSQSRQSERHLRLGLINDLKLLFAALTAGGRVVPLGDNSHAARLLAEYANSLRRH